MSEKYYIWNQGQFFSKAGSWEFAFGSNKEIDEIVLRRAHLFDSVESANNFASDVGIKLCLFLSIEQEGDRHER